MLKGLERCWLPDSERWSSIYELGSSGSDFGSIAADGAPATALLPYEPYQPRRAKVLSCMRKNKLTLWMLIESDGAAAARCWALMAKLDVDYANIERALADLVPGDTA